MEKNKLIGMPVECTERPGHVGHYSYYDPYSGEVNVTYENEVIITHISKCRVMRELIPEDLTV